MSGIPCQKIVFNGTKSGCQKPFVSCSEFLCRLFYSFTLGRFTLRAAISSFLSLNTFGICTVPSMDLLPS